VSARSSDALTALTARLAAPLQLPATAIVPLALLVGGWLLMFVPSYLGLSRTIWAGDEQGHGPIILAVSLWLLWQRRQALATLPRAPAPLAAAGLLVLGVLAYALGRSQVIWTLEIGAQIVVLVALLLAFFGVAALRLTWFPLLFLVFMIPWPGDWVATVTTPLKMAVSSVASTLLHALGYPVGRSGVILVVGPYQLLVADACAGLNSMFTLEALGLLYMNLMRYTSLLRNVLLAVLIIPIAFVANVVRVMILVLVTYHFGDETGQGFVHGFAGLVLFLVALSLIFVVDHVLGWALGQRQQHQGQRGAAQGGR
jgi:exosortase B